jgi:hypothetical protein
MSTQSPALRTCTGCHGSGRYSFGHYCRDCGGLGFERIPPSAPANLSQMAIAVVFRVPAQSVPALPSGFKFVEVAL